MVARLRHVPGVVAAFFVVLAVLITGCDQSASETRPLTPAQGPAPDATPSDLNPQASPAGQDAISGYCADRTREGACSRAKPQYCEQGVLVNKSSVCGCPGGFVIKDDGCESELLSGPKEHSFIFTRGLLIGSREYLNFTTYAGLDEYYAGLERGIWYTPGVDPVPTQKDHVLRNIDDPPQQEAFDSLVALIKERSADPEEQARIAMSFVQMIPYDDEAYLKKNITGKFAYEVLHTDRGVCGEKSQLIIALLRKLGFGTAYFVFEKENHATAAIKCTTKYSYLGSGYCFIEATQPALVGQSNNNYVDVGKLSYNPTIYPISDGYSYTAIGKQIEDAKQDILDGKRYEIVDRSGARIARIKGDLDMLATYPDVIVEYPR